MIGARTRRALVLQLSLYCVVFAPGLAFAQGSHGSGREGFTGQQLFEHQWKWIDRSNALVADEALGSDDLLEQQKKRERLRARTGFAPEQAENERLTMGDGLGPLHNARSCAECHPGGGASGVEHNVTHLTIDPRSEVIRHPSNGAATLRELFPGLLEGDGTLLFDVVVHDRSTRDGYDELRGALVKHVPGGIGDAWFVPEKRTIQAIASQPVIAGRFRTVDFYLSQRNSPPLFGLGRIESIPIARILEIAARQPEESGGSITGRFVGKFGWRGQGLSVSQIVTDACVAELGLAHDNGTSAAAGFGTSAPIQATRPQPGDPADPDYVNVGVDVTQRELQDLTSHVSSIPQPVELAGQQQAPKELLAGELLFSSTGCERCHVADLHPVRGLFSDLLLHDMGPALQAPSPAPVGDLGRRVKTVPPPKFSVKNAQSFPSRGGYYGMPASQPIPVAAAIAQPEQPRFPRGESLDDELTWDALQREWRTPPLWGVADTAPYLHDGRAATLEEAIMWHGGEGESAKKRFAALSQPEKNLMLGFLSSLRAPKSSQWRTGGIGTR